MSKKFWWSIVIFFIVLALFLLPYGSWYFDIDDCGVIWSSRFTCLHDFFALFIKGKNGAGLYFPSNYTLEIGDCRPFLNSIHSFYRPLTLVLFGFQYLFFGDQAYPYFLVMILFHAGNVVLLFNIFYILIQSYVWAALGALFFGFHLSYWGWMGWIAAQPYTISLFCLLLATVFFVKYLKTGRMRYNLASCMLYGIAVFLFEFTFVFPVFITSLWFIHTFLKEQLKLPVLSCISYIKRTLGLWFAALMFLVVRQSVCSSGSQGLGVGIAPETFFEHASHFFWWLFTRKADAVSFLVDMANISFISPGNQMLKGSLVIGVGIVLSYLFINSAYKRIIIFCFFNCVLFLWPAVLKQYTLRYLYYSLPFFAFMQVMLVYPAYLHFKLPCKRVIILIFCWMVVIGNAYFITIKLKERVYGLQQKAQALEALVNNKAIHGRVLCFVAIPRGPFASGLAQHIWMLGANCDLPIFYDPSTFVELGAGVRNRDLVITSVARGLRFTSFNRQLVWWQCFGGENMRLGKKMVLAQDARGVYDMLYEYDQKIVGLDPLFIAWDYEIGRFRILVL